VIGAAAAKCFGLPDGVQRCRFDVPPLADRGAASAVGARLG
jgi:hypothetical protein